MQRPKRLIRILPPLTLGICLLVVYLTSMAPGLSWANYGADGGDLIAAAATGGVAHPTGYPLYLLLARVFQLVPIGSLAFRTNLLSACATSVAAVVVYGLVTRSLSPSDPLGSWLPGLASGFAFGLAPLVWSQAVITEVYALHSLFVALILTLSVAASDIARRTLDPAANEKNEPPGSQGDTGRGDPTSLHPAQKRMDRWLGLTLGLAMGNHVTSLLLLPVLFSGSVPRKTNPTHGKRGKDAWQLNSRSILCRLAWLGVGLLPYLTLPLRALSQPPVNWGNPLTLDGFVWLVSGKLYQGQLFVLTLSSIWERVRVVAALYLEQFGIPALCIGLIGLIIYFKPSSLYRTLLWIAAASSAFAILYATTDAFMYLIPAFLCFAIWIGLGLGGVMDASSQRFRRIGPLLGSVLILILFVQGGTHRSQVDASVDLRAEHFGEDVLVLAPVDAIVFAKGDRAVFALWYFQFAQRNRPDLAIVATDLLQFDWYQQTLHSTYPDLKLPVPFPFSETVIVANPSRPFCMVQYDQSAEISCFPAREPNLP